MGWSGRGASAAAWLAVGMAPAAAPAADWPRFRGPSGDGVAEATADPPVEWAETKNIAWKTAIPGRGRSSPAVVGDRVFLTTAAEQGVKRTRIGPDDMQTAEHVGIGAVCLDRASGKILWQVTLREIDKPDPVHWLNSWATPTPVAEAGRVWCDFGANGTWCLDAATGKTVWEKRLPLNHMVGPGSSPILAGGRLILVRDGCDAQYVTALDKATGAEVWKTPRPPIKVPHDSMRKSFSTPLLIRQDGRTQMVSTGPHWMVSYDPATGKEFWRARHGDGFSIGSCPVFDGGLVIFSTGCFKPVLVAVRPDGQGDVTASHIAWRSQKGIPVMSSPVIAGDALYWTSDDGTATCADLKTGEARWQERLGGDHLASPVLAAGRLYVWCKDGKTTVVKAGKAFEKFAENRLEGLVTATPAVVDSAIFLRTDTHLYRIEKRDKAAAPSPAPRVNRNADGTLTLEIPAAYQDPAFAVQLADQDKINLRDQQVILKLTGTGIAYNSSEQPLMVEVRQDDTCKPCDLAARRLELGFSDEDIKIVKDVASRHGISPLVAGQYGEYFTESHVVKIKMLSRLPLVFYVSRRIDDAGSFFSVRVIDKVVVQKAD